VIWSAAQYRFGLRSDEWPTGSSIMPKKRNPDAAELVRAKIGRIFGANVALMTIMKGLPLAYSKDMQDDKPPVFEAHDLLGLSIAAMTGMIAEIEFKPKRMRELAESGYATATDFADWLVREARLPFREAHHVTGAVVALAEKQDCGLADLTLAQFQQIDERITAQVFDVLSVDASVASRSSYGGTAPVQVKAQIEKARTRLALET